jgi:hypothetical protein
MILEVHDNEPGNTLAGKVNNIEYDYMAEQWVQDLVTNEKQRLEPPKFTLDKFVLMDSQGARAVWKVHENGDAELIEKTERFTGQWVLNHRFSPRV